MTRGRGRGRGSTGRIGKSLGRGNMPTVPISTVSPQQAGTSSAGGQSHINQVEQSSLNIIPPVAIQPSGLNNSPPVVPIQASGQDSTSPVHLESSPVTSNQINIIGGGTSSQNNTIGDQVECSNTNGQRTLVTISSTGLEPSRKCSEHIYNSFKHELDPNGINWKSVSKEMKNFYFGEFKKIFFWDSSIDTIVKKQWERKAALRYSVFVSKIKGNKVHLDHIPENVLNNWRKLWTYQKCVKKSETNAKNRRGHGNERATGTHTGGSINIGEHRKRHVVEMGRDPTPSEIHLHVHTHDHDGKSFIGDRSRIVHEKYEEILQNQTQNQPDIDQFEAYYQVAGGENKKRLYGLGSQAKSYYGSKLNNFSSLDASASTVPSNAQSKVIENMNELVTQLVPALTEHIIPALTEKMLPGLVERVTELISSVSHQPTIPVAPATGKIDEIRASNSDNGRDSPTSH